MANTVLEDRLSADRIRDPRASVAGLPTTSSTSRSTAPAAMAAGTTPVVVIRSSPKRVSRTTSGGIPLAVTKATEPVFAAHYGQDRADMFFHSSS